MERHLAATATGIKAPTQDDDVLERWAQTRNIRRDFWLSLGVFVATEGLVAFVAILFSGFPFDRQLSRTLLSAILCATVALAGLALVKRRWLRGYARMTVVAAALAFPLLVAFIWVPEGGAWSDLRWSVVVVLVGGLAVSAQRLWLSDWTGAIPKRAVFMVTAVSVAVTVPLAIAAIWGASSIESNRAFAAFSLLAFVGFLLTPILRRALRKRSGSAGAGPPDRTTG
jgi:hypothetical protein